MIHATNGPRTEILPTKKARPAEAGRAVCVRTPFRMIAVRRSLRDLRPSAPQAGGRNHETRPDGTREIRGGPVSVLRCPGFSRCETTSAAALKRLYLLRVTRTAPRRWDREVVAATTGRFDPAGRVGHESFTTPRHRQAVRESTAIPGRASPHTISESCVVSIQVRGCKAFVTQIDCAPELTSRREVQAIGTKNLARRQNSRAESARFLKVTRAGWHDVASRITRAKFTAEVRLLERQLLN